MSAVPCRPRPYDLDLSDFGDEELVVLAQECGYRPAAHALLARHHPWVSGLIARKARSTTLSAADVEDAGQEAVFWVLEGIASYDTLELARPRGCRFRSFLYPLIGRRFIDFARRLWRRHRRLAPAGPQTRCEAAGVARVEPGCPAKALERQEDHQRLLSALDRLEESDRRLWDRLAGGAPLRDIAEELGLSYPQAKRQRRQLLARLVAQLQGQGEEKAR
jgi:RNA polymerase sigma factor (sigma-70 family)